MSEHITDCDKLKMLAKIEPKLTKLEKEMKKHLKDLKIS